ncbi:hypothetical protein GCM10016455_24730 [Aliiroseovarius zhejiangensis]|uniref:Capsule polysaccharide biosynthesis protein n=1 Tax=Aliiroseovarius zhejiangensis TaxID=1632025 RepID=A0ABQ3J926_9RHOB|nr:hypothetical protein [Aliiroseovarius zhejiangensis]GHF02553.1 hypothetical protein GCM10016455_24730 [Aliiroseovarius zhejiangensis]
MPVTKILRVYLDPEPLQRARQGKFNFVNKIAQTLEARGFRIEYRKNSDVQRLRSVARKGYALFLMDEPLHDRALTMRRSYFYPFWRIEASAKRWEFEVAQKAFDPGEVDPRVARDWADNWRKWLFKGAASQITRDGPIYVPLQGRLLHHRSFQAASPVEMLEQVATHFPNTPILATLHPGEVYTQAEHAALNTLVSRHPNVTLATGQMNAALAACRFVVTQNSSAALFGFFFGKPAVLYGRIDFHHIAANVHELGVQEAFDAVQNMSPEFDRYLYWFTMLNAIQADAEDCEDQILRTLRKRGWQVD